MRWNELFTDLEAQLEFGHWQGVEQDAAELTRGMWAELTLMDRLRATLRQTARLMLQDGRLQTIKVLTVGPTWVGGADDGGAILIPRQAIVGVEASLKHAVVPSRPLFAGPSLLAVFRALARRREAVQVIGLHGSVIAEGTIDRVGKDHFDIALHARDEFRRASHVQGARVISCEAISLVRAAPWSLQDI